MSLPTGKYRAVVLWVACRRSKVWDVEFILTETSEREQAIIFPVGAGVFAGHCGLNFKDGRFEMIDPSKPLPVVMLELAYSTKYKNTQVAGVSATGDTLLVDTRFNSKTFAPEDF